MPLLTVQNVDFSYTGASRKSLSGINFKLNAGEYVAVVGSNGSGKSTFARLLAGFIQPDSGTVTTDNSILPGIVFQQPKEQIVAGVVSRDTAFGPQNLKMSKSEIELRTMECLSVTGLLDRASSRTFELSLGQTQRLAFSGILALFPDLLILDEVTAMLDPSSREEILSFIDEWNQKGHTIIHITHDLDEVRRAERVVAFSSGECIFDDSAEKFFESDELTGKLFEDSYSSHKKNTFSESEEITLSVKDLKFSYSDRNIFSNLSFSLKKGTLTALTGPSGCGKSTLMECLAGLHSVEEGKIYSVTRPVLSLQESEAALFEQFAADDVAFGPRNQGVKGKQLIDRVKKSMELAGLPYEDFGERHTFEMSGGEKRRLSLAGIIALDSEIILFDEPTAGLDSHARSKVMKTLRLLADEGKTVLFSTHRMEEAAFADSCIQWETILAGEKKSDEERSDVETNLPEQKPIKNSSMLVSLQKSSLSFMAPPKIPDSIVNRMNPLVKYLVFLSLFCTSLAVRPLTACAVMLFVSFVYCVLAKYPLKKIFLSFAKLLPWLLFFAVFQFIFFPAEKGETLLVHWGYFSISRSKIIMVISMILRTLSAVVCVGTFVYTTSEREILDGLDSLLMPLALIKIPVRYAVLTVGIMFRFIPLLLDEAAGILKVQLVRGGLGETKGFGKIKVLLPLFVPLMLQTFRKAEAFADGLTARYFR